MSPQSPNILVIQADQLAAGALTAYGNSTVKAPHIHRLALDGAVFGRAYCNAPLCAPSRASMMTGELPSTIEAYDNAAEFPSSIPTFAHHLRARGYRTALAGRMHFIGPDQLHGFEERLTTDVYPADLGMVPDWSLADDERLAWYHDSGSVREAGVSAATLQRDYDDEVLFRTLRHLTDLARRPADDPFLLVASFIHPHDPYEAPQEHWDRYDDVEIDLPRVGAIRGADADPHSRRLLAMSELDDDAVVDEAVVRRARRAYYASVSYLDDQIGQIVAKLDDLGLRENTVIVLTSDHGDMLGERGLWYKMAPFEGSARVPLIVNAPGIVEPGRIHQTVSLVDLLPTLVDVAEGGLDDRVEERPPVPVTRSAALDAPNPYGAGR
ncbi:MAG: choline-sulfatase, partial [Solirubrobacteraceae bacterium]